MVADHTRIFICYKKRGSDGRDNNSAYQLYQFLTEIPEYDVWMDEGLDAGLLWEKTIYENLLSSDVLILAVGDGTSQSEWVRRELSIAMAFGVQIVPVGLSIEESVLHEELQKLGLTGIHYKRPFNISSQTARAIVSELDPAVQRAKENTRSSGHALLRSIVEKTKPVSQPALPNLSVANKQFQFGSNQLNLHIASGDIFRLANYDILVNSENDYMQMARIFDMASVSSSIRHHGSSTEMGFLEDTIQLEIEKKIVGRPRPVPAGTALVTSSGGPTSTLYTNTRVSHIIHVASVQAVLAEHRIAPLQSEAQVRGCVTSALVAVQEIYAAHGIVSPENTAQRRLQEQASTNFLPKSLVLPLFGTGRGGQKPINVGPVIISAVLEFHKSPLYEDEHFPISDIHLSVFSADDVAPLVKCLNES